MRVTEKQQQIFATTLELAKKRELVEAQIIRNLQDVDKGKLYQKYDCASLFTYAVKYYRFTPAVAYDFKVVAKAARQIPRLQAAIEGKEITVSAARRLLPAMTNDNADHLIHFCKTHSYRETEKELGKMTAPSKPIESVKRLKGGIIKVTVSMTEEEYETLERAKSLEAKCGRNLSTGQMISKSLELFVERKDPVKKAERAEKRHAQKYGAPQNLDFSDIETSYGRENMTAAQINAVVARDKGQCTHTCSDGGRCVEKRFTEIHHKMHIRDGGSNHPTNLETLCWFHHDQKHQMELPIYDKSRIRKKISLRSCRSTYGPRGPEQHCA